MGRRTTRPDRTTPQTNEPRRDKEKRRNMTEDAVDLERMLDLTTPWCLRVAATLRIPEHIKTGRTEIAELAAAAGCDTDALHAVLGHLVSQGVFTQPSPGRFAVNRPAEELAKNAVPRPRRHRRPDGPHLGHAARLRPHRPAGLPAGVRPALLGGPGRPSADSGGIRRAHGTGRARHSRLRHRAQRRLGIHPHRGRRRRRDRGHAGLAAPAPPSRPKASSSTSRARWPGPARSSRASGSPAG